MAIDVTTNVDNIAAFVLNSVSSECVAVINVLSDLRHHAFFAQQGQSLLNALPQASRAFLDKVAGLPFQGIEFYELLLDCRMFDSVPDFADAIRRCDRVKFIRVLTGEELSAEKIEGLIDNRDRLAEFLSDLPWAYRGKDSVYESIFCNTEDFKNSLADILTEINDNFIAGQTALTRNIYVRAAATLEKELKQKSPLALGEEIMNRRIEPDGAVKEFIFIPSNYISPHFVMAYNKTARMFIYDIKGGEENAVRSVHGLSAALKILSDESRLEILRLLILQPTYGKILADRLKLTTATISHHIDLLASVGLIEASRDKNTKFINANEERIEELIEELRNYLYNK